MRRVFNAIIAVLCCIVLLDHNPIDILAMEVVENSVLIDASSDNDDEKQTEIEEIDEITEDSNSFDYEEEQDKGYDGTPDQAWSLIPEGGVKEKMRQAYTIDYNGKYTGEQCPVVANRIWTNIFGTTMSRVNGTAILKGWIHCDSIDSVAKPGDFIYCGRDSSGNLVGSEHYGIYIGCRNEGGDKFIYLYEGNYNNAGVVNFGKGVPVSYYGNSSIQSGYHFGVYHAVNYDEINGSVNNRPIGVVDDISVKEDGKVHIKGWAYDKDDTSKQLDIHVYVGEPSSPSNLTADYVFKADKYRPDVNNSSDHKGVGEYHGFEETFITGEKGKQAVYIYAIDALGGDDYNIELVNSGKTITIPDDTPDTNLVVNGLEFEFDEDSESYTLMGPGDGFDYNGSLTIPERVNGLPVTAIDNGAFSLCTGIKGDLVISGSVKRIGREAFFACESLTSVTFNEGLDTIGNSAFYACTGLKGTITLPASLQSIGDKHSLDFCTTNVSKIVNLSSCTCNLPKTGIPDDYEWVEENDQTKAITNIKQGTALLVKKKNTPKQGFSITYVLDGGTNDERNPESYTTSKGAIKLYSAEKSGYKFTGWYYYTGTKLTKLKQIPPNAARDYMLYAKWSVPIKYTITYNLNKGNLKNQAFLKNYTVENDNYTLPIPKRDGYRFAGWYTTKTFDDSPITQIITSEAKKVILYARWTYQIRFDANASDASGSMDTMTAQSGAPICLNMNSFARDGYTFNGWSTNPNGGGKKFKDEQIIKDNPTPKISEISTLYAMWKGNPYTIVFNSNGGTGKMSDMKCIYGKQYKLVKNRYKNAGRTFKGWNTKSDGTGEKYDDQEMISNLVTQNKGSVVLYAQWEN